MKPATWLAVAALSGCMPIYQSPQGEPSYEDRVACNKEGFESKDVGWVRGNPLAFVWQDQIMAAFDVCMKRKGYTCTPRGDMAQCP